MESPRAPHNSTAYDTHPSNLSRQAATHKVPIYLQVVNQISSQTVRRDSGHSWDGRGGSADDAISQVLAWCRMEVHVVNAWRSDSESPFSDRRA